MNYYNFGLIFDFKDKTDPEIYLDLLYEAGFTHLITVIVYLQKWYDPFYLVPSVINLS